MGYDYPIHNGRRLTFSSPKELKRILLQDFPLTKEFIDWTIERGFKIAYQPDWKAGTGLVSWRLKQIMMSSQGTIHLKDKTLVHELIHISVPGIHKPEASYEKVIDQIADIYLNDSEFMKYLKKKISAFKKS